jgi:rare lipoprotein A (peptidoglycan hydrolase)
MPLPRPSAAAATCACLIVTATAANALTHVDTASLYNSARVTTSGEKFDESALKAAHRTLPFGSIVKVVNLRSGKSVVVEVNDRTKSTRRTIRLTREAGERIGVVRHGAVPVRLEVAQLTRSELDRAFLDLTRVLDAKAEAEALEARADLTPQPAADPRPIQVAAAIAGEITLPVHTLGNVFKSYVESLIVPASAHVVMSCPDGRPLPDKLRAVLRRAAWDFNQQVEVISGYRSLSYNRHVYGNRRSRRGGFAGDRSQHIMCRAADFRIAGVSAARLHAWALQQPELGGVGRYRGDFIHVDIRPRPSGRLITWDWRAKTRYARKLHHYARKQPRLPTQRADVTPLHGA